MDKEEKQYKLEIYLAPNFNPHHPDGGWFQTGNGEISWCKHLEDLALSNGASKTRVTEIIAASISGKEG